MSLETTTLKSQLPNQAPVTDTSHASRQLCYVRKPRHCIIGVAASVVKAKLTEARIFTLRSSYICEPYCLLSAVVRLSFGFRCNLVERVALDNESRAADFND